MACAAARIDTATCSGDGRKADHALRMKQDRLMGSDQVRDMLIKVVEAI